ncbi:hypothetical protein Nhal_0788 [Nitrosococcus halophilus Nc 4]|uniref:HTH cro/C1-type domain-containing protein n=1 Tax=Nitrosococcus halophilus (strain Nc4) TaxID=472759 RepID=D5BXL0_NITHN|nr:hypothetical protein [Nitrosococcus halophilus]ADE13968.1 hypothetical protein Nhal_0788 [Nitrosococcus halophilus Nc 4]
MNIRKITPEKLTEELASLLHSLVRDLNDIYEPGAGRRLLGLPEDPESHELPSPSELDISHYEMTHIMQALYEYLDKNEWDTAGKTRHLLDYVTRARYFTILFRDGSPLGMNIEGPVHGYCKHIADTAFARWALEEDAGITIKDLALIADVTEKTIRMAANPKLPDPLKTTRSGGRTYIDQEEALRWLKKRPGFRETRYFDSAEEGEIPEFDSVQELGQFIAAQRNKLGLSLEQIAEKLEWSPEILAAFQALEKSSDEFDSDPIDSDELFFGLGKLLRLDANTFAINAYKVAIWHTFKCKFQQVQEKYGQKGNTNTEHRK